MELAGKSALVTGGGTGVGRATALRLARAGCNVAINYRESQAEAEETAREIEAAGVNAVVVQADVAEDDACRRLVDQTTTVLGGLDVLVNNAGTTSFIAHHELDRVGDADWDRILAVNLKGPFQCTRAAREALAANGGGEVVNVSSVAGIRGIGSSIPYACSKAALNNLTVMLARVLAPEIRVNAVAPGFIAGRWLEKGFGAAYEAMKEGYEARVPLKSVCEPDDVAAAILGLITGSDLVTGQVLPVDAGFTIAQ